MKKPSRTPVLECGPNAPWSTFGLPVLAVFLAGGCPSSGQIGGQIGGEIDAGSDQWADADTSGSGGEAEFADAAPVERCDKMDILFVIDDSLSMAEEQENLAANFPGFIEVLDQYTVESGQTLDYRVAVTTTGRNVSYTVLPPALPVPFPVEEVGSNGAFLDDSSCGATRAWLERGDSDVAGTFSCLAQVGTGGPNLEMPLLAVELALVDRVEDGTNFGFLRDDALLALVILTDEDDCSRRDDGFQIESLLAESCVGSAFDDVARYLALLDGIKGDRARWAAAVIAGPGPGICQSTFGAAFEARRLQQFVVGVGANAVFSSICEGDLTGALMNALDTFDEACQDFPPIL